VRAFVAATILWTVLVGTVLLFTPSLVSAPPCSGLLEPGPGCQVLNDAANNLAWTTQQRPIAILSVGGYLVIAIFAFARRSR
jgi:hypothetical protein